MADKAKTSDKASQKLPLADAVKLVVKDVKKSKEITDTDFTARLI